jgi:putative DNA primase/helicase
MDTLMAQSKSGGIPNDIARLFGARMVTAMEGEEKQKLAQSLVKQLTGGDVMTARFLRKEFFEFTPQLKLWMATNHKPKLSGDDPAIWRRVHMIPFNVVIPKDEQDQELPNKLRDEMSGILNWAIKGAIEWNKNGLQPPEEVLAATRGYQSEMDTFSRFCKDAIVDKPDVNTTKAELYHAYCDWRHDEGGDELGKAEVAAKMKRLGYNEGRSKSERYWKDIELDVVNPHFEATNSIR